MQSLYQQEYFEVEPLLYARPSSLSAAKSTSLLDSIMTTPGKKFSTNFPSPNLSSSIEKHLYASNLCDPRLKPVYWSPNRALSSTKYDSEIKQSLRKSLEEISNNIKELEDFITVTEDIMKQDRERDNELYTRERYRRKNNSTSPPSYKRTPPVRRARASVKSPVLKIRIAQERIKKTNSPKSKRSRLYFKNGKIGCAEAERCASNITSTHRIVKEIIGKEQMYPLVSDESVQKALADMEEIIALTGDLQPMAELKGLTDVEHTSSEKLLGTPIKEVELALTEAGSGYDSQEPAPIDEVSVIAATDQPLTSHGLAGNYEEDDHFVSHRLRHLITRFSERGRHMRKLLDLPPTPSSSASSPSSTRHKIDAIKIYDDNENKFNIEDIRKSDSYGWICPIFCGFGGQNNAVLDPQGRFYISWLFVVSLSFMYNSWVIPLRSSFPFQTPENTPTWIAVDICADIVYLVDILFVKHRLMYLYEGFWVRDKNLTRQNYMKKLQFKMDLLALLPLDLLYFKFGTNHVMLRCVRLLKIQSFWGFFKLFDRVIASPHVVRVVKTLTYMLFMIHCTACSYYAYSDHIGLGTDRWVFSGKGHPYVRCFSFATKTATSIGKNPKPETKGEFMFMTVAWLMGVFIFALLIGQIRDIIATATRLQAEYKQLVDETLEYMRRLNLPTELQHRVKMWFTFTWEQQRSLDETNILDTLPQNLKTDIAISVHIQTLSKVKLFADCEEALLRELVLSLRSMTFLPGDYVCRKGEVGKEMYIIKTGQVNVMGGKNNDEVLATLSEGSVFGEISLLAINGAEGNRRTAYVQSKGYSNLFVLSKADLNEAIIHYPNAQAILKKRAKSLMRKNAAREKADEQKVSIMRTEPDIVIANPNSVDSSPLLLKTVIEALPEESTAAQLLTQGSKRVKKNKLAQKKEQEPADVQQTMQHIPSLSKSCDNVNLTDAEKRALHQTASDPGALNSINVEKHICDLDCGDVTVHREM